MTSYNREKYIGEAIQSVLVSTYENFELIIVDDCSSDRTVEIAKSFAEKDGRVKLYVNERNLGQFENRNLAARYANGLYLKYLDSDDLSYPIGREILVSMLQQFPEAGYGLCSLDQDQRRMFPFKLTPVQAYERHFLQGIPLFHKAPLSSIIKKDAFFSIGGFANPGGEGDYEMWLTLSSKYDVVLMPQGIVWYRVHDEQIDSRRRADPFLRFKYFLVTQRYMAGNCPLDGVQARLVAKGTHDEMVKSIIHTFFKHSPGKAAQMYRASDYRLPGFAGKVFSVILNKIRKH